MADPLLRAAAGHPLTASAAQRAAADRSQAGFEALLGASRELRDRAWSAPAAAARGGVGLPELTFSPKVFLPLTNLCRNRCDYCSFRRSWGQKGAETFSHDTTLMWLDRGEAQGCVEALFCLGDTPESEFPEYAALLASWGHTSTVDYLDWAGRRALERGLLPHTNAGVLSAADIARLRATNVSQGLMLENISPRLCGPGMVHRDAPDKHPDKRMAMLRAAGQLKVPFTTGVLLGIGETQAEIVDSLLAIRELHLELGHIQEVIVQNFRARPRIPMHGAPEPDDVEIARNVALARLILPAEISVQAPPNLNPNATRLLIDAGINDFGGISPVTPDYINPIHPWPHLLDLEAACREAGFALRPRLPVYPTYVARPGFVEPALRPAVAAAQARVAAATTACDLLPRGAPTVRAPQSSQPTPDIP